MLQIVLPGMETTDVFSSRCTPRKSSGRGRCLANRLVVGHLVNDPIHLCRVEARILIVKLQQHALYLLDLGFVDFVKLEAVEPLLPTALPVPDCGHDDGGNGDGVGRVVEAHVSAIGVVDEVRGVLQIHLKVGVDDHALHGPVRMKDNEVELELLHKKVLGLDDFSSGETEPRGGRHASR